MRKIDIHFIIYQAGKGNRAISLPEALKKMFSCWLQQQLAIIFPSPPTTHYINLSPSYQLVAALLARCLMLKELTV